MTAIAGIAENGIVWLGGDSAGVADYSLLTVASPKVFRNGELIIGYTDSFRMGQLLEHELAPPKPTEGDSSVEYMIRRFIPAVRECFSDNGYQSVENEQIKGGQFLVGFRGSLFIVEENYQVLSLRESYCAVGCGQDLVLGSLHTTEQFEMRPRERLECALAAAAAYSAGVREPFTIISTEE